MSSEQIEYCVVWLGPCLGVGEWFAFWQAAGGLLAVAAAVGVLWAQLREGRAQRLLAARVTWIGIYQRCLEMRGALEAAGLAFQDPTLGDPKIVLRQVVALLGGLPLPSHEELMTLSVAGSPYHSFAETLVQGVSVAKMVNAKALHAVAVPHAVRQENLQHLAQETKFAAMAFRKAIEDYERILAEQSKGPMAGR